MALLYLLCLAIGSIFWQLASTQTPCSSYQTDPQQCLPAIRTRLTGNDLFWFGINFATRCSQPRMRETFNCILGPPALVNLTTIVRRLPGSIDITGLNRLVQVNYTSEPGEYTSCNARFRKPNRQIFLLDPVSDTAYEPWLLRAMPAVTWQADQNQIYSLLVFDVGFQTIHGLYLDINGNDLAGANMIRAYFGPLNVMEQTNVYAFVLYNQGMATTNQDVPAVVSTLLDNLKSSVTDMNSLNQLITNLRMREVGINLLRSTYDGYAMDRVSNIGYNCPLLVERALQSQTKHDISWLRNRQLSVFVNITYSPQELNFPYCGLNYHYGAETFSLNPLEDPLYSTARVRTDALSTREFPRAKLNSDTTVRQVQYTLLMVDPHVIPVSLDTIDRPFIHWLVINIPAASASTGGTPIHVYGGPKPPYSTPHTLYFLLYEQSRPLTLTNTDAYTGDACRSFSFGRCYFQVERFRNENDLTLVGVNWMMVMNDAYVNWTAIVDSNLNEADFCPTATTGAGAAQVALLALLTVLVTCVINYAM